MHWIVLLLLIAVIVVLGYRLKVKRHQALPTLRHALFASHLANRSLFRGEGLR